MGGVSGSDQRTPSRWSIATRISGHAQCRRPSLWATPDERLV